jgi:linoleoyl-CoA desaturase
MKPLRFSAALEQEFTATLKKRVQDYFSQNKKSSFGDLRLYSKTLIMLALYLIPYFLIIFLNLPWYGVLLLYTVMGFGMVGIGMSVMHDANHGSFSSIKNINKLFSYSMELLGGNSFNWKMQHNLFHHTYTNIPGYDEDIAHKSLLRLEPTGVWKKIHRYQHIYALPLYSLLTINWLLIGDYFSTFGYNQSGKTEKFGFNKTKETIKLFVFKILYLFFQFVLPIFILGITWWHVILGFVIMQLIAGFIFSTVFQLAHVVEETDYPLPDGEGILPHNWSIHQMVTTANFARKNKFLSWFIGGLNYQIEHHLFPNISHVHYPQIAEIVKKTAAEFKIPYNEYKSFRAAVISHIRKLKSLGQSPALA